MFAPEETSSELTLRFELLERAGAGGSAEVWRARDHGRGSVVALKIERSAGAREALAREAMHAALALSPRLPELIDVGWIWLRGRAAHVTGAPRRGAGEPDAIPGGGRRAFVALRWVEGRSAAEVPCGLGAAERVALALAAARDAGEALADLHAIGLAHGDLKPENLIVSPEGRVDLIDLGIACALHQAAVEGGTLRYLAREDAELGDARARDLLALGVLLAEIAAPEIAAANDPIQAARAALRAAPRGEAPGLLQAICGALLSPNPAARPSAAWVTESAQAALLVGPGSGGSVGLSGRAAGGGPAPRHQRERQERDARRVRAAYLRLRRGELEEAGSARDEAAPWLTEALALVQRARAIVGSRTARAGDAPALSRLGPDRIVRWLMSLVGTSAAAWPVGALMAVPERDLAEALTALARRIPPRAWTFGDVEEAALGRGARRELRAARGVAAPLDAAESARLAIAITRAPPDPLAIEAIEQRMDAPAALVTAAADALRLHGDFGRARSLVLRAAAGEALGAAALAAEVLRRAGERGLAEERARAAIEGPANAGSRPTSTEGPANAGSRPTSTDGPANANANAGSEGVADPEGRARAVLARIAIDEGRLDAAATLAGDAMTAPLCEIRALIAVMRGDEARALAEVERAEVLAGSAEERARAAALRGYACHASDPARALAAFAAAVDYAVRAGAVIEEATYRTGEAAAAVDLGELERAIETSTRAALLWEHLGRPAQAARALLACAAAYATAGVAHETARVAREAIARARDAGDARAEASAWWAIADVILAGDAGPLPPDAGDSDAAGAHLAAGTEDGACAAERAAALLGDAGPDDALRAAARLWRHRAGELDEARVEELDRLAASDAPLSVAARLDWWGSRAARKSESERAPNEDRSEPILAALAALAGSRAPIASRGPALAAGLDLALRAGQTDLARRLLAALGDAARELCQRAAGGARGELAYAVRALPWVARARAAPEAGLRPEQARDLEALVRSLSDRERLVPLLNRVVDALVLWTGVERGLLLLKAPSDRLRVRAARNLGRSDLSEEQMALSQTLAHKALEAGEPVVAVDAAGELPSVHHSVHALKLRSVLAVPLIARGEALGVVYLDDRVRRGAFGPEELRWARTVASLAALAIADARDQVLLRRAARRAERASARLVEALAHREAALDVAERELAKARGARGTRYRYDEMIGESEPIRAMLRIVDRVTAAEVPVLLSGESGSGKELVARAIHANGPRASRPFVSENCGAIPEGLLESALFGHVRGAFTGAERPRAGLFEVADRGTLFLDEIGEMSLPMQTKLLRVLEDGMIRPVGSERTRKVDVRVIAATHRDLEAMVRARTFREDLFYRLNIITIRIPPLRERTGDVPLIVQHLIAKHRGGPARVTRAAMDRLMRFPWPGNVRQLENEIRRALVLSDGTIDVEQLSPEIARSDTAQPRELGLNVRARIDAIETDLVREAMDRTHGNQTQAAKLLGLSRFGLQKMIKRLAIEF